MSTNDYAVSGLGTKSLNPIDEMLKRKFTEDSGSKQSFPISVVNPSLMAVNNVSTDGESGGMQA